MSFTSSFGGSDFLVNVGANTAVVQSLVKGSRGRHGTWSGAAASRGSGQDQVPSLAGRDPARLRTRQTRQILKSLREMTMLAWN